MRGNRSLLLAVPLALAALTLGACDLFVQRSEGEKLWRELCADCHGLDAAGNTARYMGNPWADLRDDSWKNDGDRATVETIVREGVFGSMPAHDELTGAQMRALMDYFYKLRGERS